MSAMRMLDFPEVKPEDRMRIFELFRDHAITMVNEDERLPEAIAIQLRRSLQGEMNKGLRTVILGALSNSLIEAYEYAESVEPISARIPIYERYLVGSKLFTDLLEVHQELNSRGE